ncbi:hypothetical protein TorRG33x02_129120 [Trema orientale]|uniref:Uncharacterized protein n=1 Tax=Trema orientale TaxID=63057 RepID=A0A2P5F0P5_TREOI|nr:hypothetical protein TorRG33x02_129120 [Trema orientale]
MSIQKGNRNWEPEVELWMHFLLQRQELAKEVLIGYNSMGVGPARLDGGSGSADADGENFIGL